MTDIQQAKKYLGFEPQDAAWNDCPDCNGSGVVFHFQHEGNEPHSGFSYPEKCGCVIDLKGQT